MITEKQLLYLNHLVQHFVLIFNKKWEVHNFLKSLVPLEKLTIKEAQEIISSLSYLSHEITNDLEVTNKYGLMDNEWTDKIIIEKINTIKKYMTFPNLEELYKREDY